MPGPAGNLPTPGGRSPRSRNTVSSRRKRREPGDEQKTKVRDYRGGDSVRKKLCGVSRFNKRTQQGKDESIQMIPEQMGEKNAETASRATGSFPRAAWKKKREGRGKKRA